MNEKNEISKTTMYSMISFLLSFFCLFLYYSLKKPDYVLDKDKDIDIKKDSKISYRLLFVYSLLFSSSIALFVFMIHALYVKFIYHKYNKDTKI